MGRKKALGFWVSKICALPLRCKKILTRLKFLFILCLIKLPPWFRPGVRGYKLFVAPVFILPDELRTSIYIDGFNFYYRAVKNTPYKWLDFKSLFVKLLSEENQILAIKYFTALVSGSQDPGQPIRQQTYLRALKKYIPEISIYYGHFISHKVPMPLADPDNKQRFIKVIKTEEKGSDVNLAVHLLNDAWLNEYDCAVVVSNDSDLAEALKIVKQQLNKIVGIVMPVKGWPSRELIKYADFKKPLRPGLLRNSQLPYRIPNTNIRKPKEW